MNQECEYRSGSLCGKAFGKATNFFDVLRVAGLVVEGNPSVLLIGHEGAGAYNLRDCLRAVRNAACADLIVCERCAHFELDTG